MNRPFRFRFSRERLFCRHDDGPGVEVIYFVDQEIRVIAIHPGVEKRFRPFVKQLALRRALSEEPAWEAFKRKQAA